MAQPTLTSRPATWAGTSGPILYKFTSTNYSNAGYYMAVEVWNSTTAAKIADAKYYSNSSGAVVVDVAPFLKSAMTLDNEADLTTGTVYTDGNWVKYYIKYREYWTASSESQVNDSGNIRYAIYGGLQTGNINSFADYIPADTDKYFLIQSDAPTAANGYPFTVSCIGSAMSAVLIEKYLNGVKGATTAVSVTDSVVNRIKINETTYDRVDLTYVKGSSVTYTNGRPTGGHGFDSVSVGHAESSAVGAGSFDGYHRAISGISGVQITIMVYVTSSDLTGSVTINMAVYNAAKSSSANITPVPVTYNGFYLLQITTGAFDPAFVELLLDNGTAGNVDWSIDAIDTPALSPLSVAIKEECSNIVVLQWKNSLGGDECFPFTYNQEYTWDYTGGKKAKRLTLFANNLTLNQWESIQGLNTLGDMYRVNITEMTTSLNRTSSTIGQSVYVLNSDGTKVGVNVIGQSNTTNTKQKRHSAIVTIEYPELFLQ